MGNDKVSATDIDPYSLKLEGASVRVKGKSDNAGTIKDVNGDGVMDLLVHIENDLTLVEGATHAKLTGLTNEGIAISGKDVIRIVQ